MNKIILTLFSIFVLLSSVKAQSAKDIFEAENLVWYGLDFSHARFIGIKDEKPEVIKNKFIELWNKTTYLDRENFALESTFRKILVRIDNKVVPARNEKVSTSTLFGKDAPGISSQTIEKTVSEYTDGLQTKGIGVVYIVEYMDKGKKEAAAHVTFFDIATRKVLLTKRLTGAAGHPGLTMYWAMAFSRIGKSISDTYFDRWQKEAK